MSTPMDDRQKAAEVAKAEAEARSAEAKARQDEIAAEKAAAEARLAQVKALVPDLSSVKESTLDIVKDATPMWGTFLSYGALQKVAESVANTLGSPPEGAWRVLVTSEPDLATSDSIYTDIIHGLDQLSTAAEVLIDAIEKAEAPDEAFVGPVDIVAAAASALPSVLSLLTAQRSLATGGSSVSDLAGAAAVAGALKRDHISVVHDEFRLVVTGGVYDKLDQVAQKKQDLLGKQLALKARKAVTDAQLAEEKAAAQLDAAKVATLTAASADLETKIALIESLTTAIDGFTAAIRAVPQGAKRSPLGIAALQDALHHGSERFTHVLLVKAQPGQMQQQLENLPFWFHDKFSSIGDISLTYVMIETEGSTIVHAGTITGTARAHGKLGDQPVLDPVLVNGDR